MSSFEQSKSDRRQGWRLLPVVQRQRSTGTSPALQSLSRQQHLLVTALLCGFDYHDLRTFFDLQITSVSQRRSFFARATTNSILHLPIIQKAPLHLFRTNAIDHMLARVPLKSRLRSDDPDRPSRLPSNTVAITSTNNEILLRQPCQTSGDLAASSGLRYCKRLISFH